MTTNPQLELAFQYVSQTQRHVYLTGKAGTGKTTFLHRICREVPKHAVVVAPTGVAAINARGVTIHSLFQLPFGLIGRGDTATKCRRFSRKKIDLLTSIDLLVIDEISMVRADVLDAIDEVLRRVRRSNKPFGGLQLLMIGDLHQLPPVVKDNERYELERRYPTAYFFGSEALQRAQPVHIELTHIYRQADEKFINLLNRVRNDELDEEVLATLNGRFRPDFAPAEAEGYITLASHNYTADGINREKLDGLPGPAHGCEAVISGNFPRSLYPNDPRQSFKIGAQVMFNKNDTGEFRAYFNGKIGKIVAIDGDTIVVACPGEEEPISVLPVAWENIVFTMDPATKTVKDEVVGTYTQHPLKLAWAITIHKSQGLTFDKVIIDAADAFAHGQVYVALSRCKTFDGIVLRSPIGDRSVKTDRVVSDYSRASAEKIPTAADLATDRRAYAQDCLQDLFRCEALRRATADLQRLLSENERSLQGGGSGDFGPIVQLLEAGVLSPAQRFLHQLVTWGHPGLPPSEQNRLDDRLKKAGVYLAGQLEGKVTPKLATYEFATDNQAVAENLHRKLRQLQDTVYVATKCFANLASGFDTVSFVRTRTAAKLDLLKRVSLPSGPPRNVFVPRNVAHPELYRKLVAWRSVKAAEREVEPFQVVHNSVIVAIADQLPNDSVSLLRVKKVGPKTLERYGEELLAIVNGYRRANPGSLRALPSLAPLSSSAS